MMNKFIKSALGSFGKIFFVLNFVLMVSTQAQDQQATPAPTPSTCKGQGCAAMSRAELFIKSFASSGNSKGLRTNDLEQEEKIKNDFYGIDATRREVEAGRLSKEQGDADIETYMKTIRAYVNDQADKAVSRAGNGQASDIPLISKALGKILTVARQDALMGREELAQHAQEQMVKVLTTFSQQFANTCEQQSFPVVTALELERQNELMGTGISVRHCANRKFSAELSSQGVNYRFESCSNLSLLTVWDVKISGRVVGEGKGWSGGWEAETVFRGFKDDSHGAMGIVEEEIEEKEESVRIPNDAGPLAKPNGWASAPIPKTPPHLKKMQFLKLRITTVHLIGDRGFFASGGPWAEAEIKREDDKPCSPLTEDPLLPKSLKF
jgi:hypothetical protein